MGGNINLNDQLYPFDDFILRYKCVLEDVMQKGGTQILFKHGNSVVGTLKVVYSNYRWNTSRFKVKPRHHWNSISNQRSECEIVAQRLGIQVLDDWNDCAQEDIIEAGGMNFTRKYDKSISKALRSIFAEQSWRFECSNTKANGYWQQHQNQLDFLTRAGEALCIRQTKDWYNVSKANLAALGAGGLLQYFPFVIQVVDANYTWDWSRMSTRRKTARQRNLQVCTSALFC